MKEEKEEKQQETMQNFDSDQWKAGPKAFIALIVAVLFFSGLMVKFPDMKWLAAFDFTTLVGNFGAIKNIGKDTFVGSGGLGARGGFMFALSLVPSVMFAIGCIEVLDHYGAIAKTAHSLAQAFAWPAWSDRSCSYYRPAEY